MKRHVFLMTIGCTFAATVLVGVDAGATPPDAVPVLTGSFDPMEKTICPSKGDGLIHLGFTLRNDSFSAVEITGTRADAIVIQKQVNPNNGNEVDVQTIEKAELYLGLPPLSGDNPKVLKDNSSFTVDVALYAPGEDGYFKTRLTVYWQWQGSKDLIGEQIPFTYFSEDGCIEAVSEEEYNTNSQRYSVAQVEKNGKIETVVTPEGFANLEPYAGEPLDKGAVDKEAAGLLLDPNTTSGAKNAEGGSAITSVLTLHVCVRMRYRDNWRVVDGWDTTGFNWWGPLGDASYRNMIGTRVEIWDYNSSGSDVYMGAFWLYYSAEGNYSCVDFTWDQAAHPTDLYPDVYVKTDYRVKDTEFADPDKRVGHFCTDSCSCGTRASYSWRSGYIANLGSSGTTGYLDVNHGSDLDGAPNNLAMQNAAFQKFFRSFHSYHMTSDIYANYETSGGAYSLSSSCIHLSGESDLRRRWDVAPHESGHSYKDQVLGHEDSSYCPGTHYGYCSYNDQCAMNEGWAEFVATRTWYTDSKTSSHPWYLTTSMDYSIEHGGHQFPTGYGPTHANCGAYACSLLTCDCYSMNEIMAARAFWDIWDDHVDGVDDVNTTTDWHYMVEIWENFPAGTCNEGCRDEDDKNMRDYHDNSSSISADLYADVWRVYQSGQTDMACQAWP
ncbi:MAG: hypothetical protein PHU25_10695 [Deltaproteobacteria bacterium]|nr:hypothetical protein [Deltaproteobacteria bacterium]